MQLVAEIGEKRTYLGNDKKTWYEVHLESQMQTYPVLATDYEAWDSDSTEEAALRVNAAISRCGLSLRSWFMEHVDFDPVGAQHVQFSSETFTTAALSERLRFTPGDFEEGRLWRIVLVSQSYWPPAPVDPAPATNERKPRKNDFRGDRFA